MKTVIKVPIYLEIESGQQDRKEVTKAVRNIIQPELKDFVKSRFNLDWLSSSQKRELRAILGDNPTLRVTSEAQILKTGIFPGHPTKYDLD